MSDECKHDPFYEDSVLRCTLCEKEQEAQLAAADELAKAVKKQRGWSGKEDCSSCMCSDCVAVDAALTAYEKVREGK